MKTRLEFRGLVLEIDHTAFDYCEMVYWWVK